ncbi:MAG: rhamnose utilization protein RhaD (predicted bifunctional aldolase and dehydrogenase) [Phenylobacterium sp.]|jgi:rhamnose utilization protein RhaD (predicted bifunctional aldolase and dehydrogenase)/NAD(P)-dependent dehydrogenase (short-subunit alcohol dehydrogenase family)
MQNCWNAAEATKYAESDLELRVYSSRLLGMNDDLVMHGGGNTSVKSTDTTIFGDQRALLYVKGSGWDLKTIEPQGFAPVELNHLLNLAKLDSLTDEAMVRELKCAMTNPAAPNPSIETILHALIPYKFVDHTHADAVVTISNTPDGEAVIKQLYGDRVLVLPFIMPGFILAKQVYNAIKDLDLAAYEGIVLLNHGVFTFADEAKTAYDKMIKLVTEAEDYIKAQGAWEVEVEVEVEAEVNTSGELECDALTIANMRKRLSELHGAPMIVQWHHDAASVAFSQRKTLAKIATRGPITPDHVIQTKRIPMILDGFNRDDINRVIEQYATDYQTYFASHARAEHTLLDKAPRVAVAPDKGFFAMAPNIKANGIVSDIYRHTHQAITRAEKLSCWQALGPEDIFALEYWSLEQAKLKVTSAKASAQKRFEGKVAFVTGAASGIGKATARELLDQGACVIATDINPTISALFTDPGFFGVVCDVSSEDSVAAALILGVHHFGGIDIVVSNAGTFPPSRLVSELSEQGWNSSLDINLSGHFRVIKLSTPYLKVGIEPSIVITGSKNVAAPGPGAAAYSCAKAGLTQLARVSALELASFGIRVNVLHPNAVFDTDIWTDEVLELRAANYGVSVDEYKKTNLLKTEITSQNVARLVSVLASSDFAKTTGAQIPIDGGNERVI